MFFLINLFWLKKDNKNCSINITESIKGTLAFWYQIERERDREVKRNEREIDINIEKGKERKRVLPFWW